jgi:hypothetical protein
MRSVPIYMRTVPIYMRTVPIYMRTGMIPIQHFVRWLNSHGHDQEVGMTWSECACPVANWLKTYWGLESIAVNNRHIRLPITGMRRHELIPEDITNEMPPEWYRYPIHEIEVPHWVGRFIEEVDALERFHSMFTGKVPLPRPVTARDALRIAERLVAELQL